MKILAIETSCDDTGIAILEVSEKTEEFSVLSNIVSSQIEVHKKYGGVYPAMAKREHQRNLVPVLIRALKQAKLLNPKSEIRNPKQIQKSKIQKLNSILERESELAKKLVPFLQKHKKPKTDLIAVTNGPGLEPCLWVGVNFAKAISYFWDIPIVPTNHIESHILVNFLENKKVKFPVISLVVSGGHTQLILMKKIGQYKILGETRDDAAGECFDKCAKILGLGYPGGPIISKLAEEAAVEVRLPQACGSLTSTKLPRPMINTKDYDFSFSGLKTAVLYADRKVKKTKQYKKEMAAEIQQAIIDVLIKKTLKAAKDFNAKTIILGGGVTANKELRKQFKENLENELVENFPRGKFSTNSKMEKIKLLVPEPKLSTDNALMVAVAGYFRRPSLRQGFGGQAKKIAWQKLQANANLRVS